MNNWYYKNILRNGPEKCRLMEIAGTVVNMIVTGDGGVILDRSQ